MELTDAKLYVPVVTLSTENNIKQLKQQNSSFKIITNWNKYQSALTKKASNRYWHYLIDPSFHGVNKLGFIVSK